MEVEDEAILLNMPDGGLNLAFEVKKPDQGKIICWSCKETLVYDRDFETVKCTNCGKLNGTTLYSLTKEYILFRCGACRTIQRGTKNHYFYRCPNCKSVSQTSR